MPRWTYGTSSSGVPLGPTEPMTSPSATVAFCATVIEPRCVRLTARPAGVTIVTDLPFVGTVPANVTDPTAGATTGAPEAAPIAMPRCSPAAYGCAGSNEKVCRTGPCTGQVHAATQGTTAASMSAHTSRRIDTTTLRARHARSSRVVVV